MAFFPDVKAGDKFQPNALLSNNIRHLVNGMNGFCGGRQIRAGNGQVSINVYSSIPLSSGVAVNFSEEGNFCGDAIPCEKLTDSKRPWGVLPNDLSANKIGTCVISGPVTVKISGDTGNFATPSESEAGIFIRGETGVPVLFVSENKALLNLGPSQSSEGEAELVYNSAFKAEVLLSSEGGGKKIRIFDPGDPSGQTAGYCDAIGSVDVYEQDFFEDTSFSLFFHIFYSHDLEKYLYEFSENSSVEGESAVSIRIASWNASEKKLIQQWWNGDIMLCYNYIV